MRKRQLVYLNPWILCVATAVVYLLFPTRVYYWDGITFAQAIEGAQGLSVSLVHPNHLVYNFVGYSFYKVLHAIGFELRAITALQILNALLSAACAGVLFVILKDSLRSLYLSVCLTLLFAFSATWWKFSTDADAYIPSVLFLLVSFYLVLPDRKPSPVLLGLTFFVSMCFHQLAIVAYPVFALGVYLQDGAISIRRRVVHAALFSLVTLGLIVGTYVLLFYLATGTFAVGKLLRWTVSYSPDADTQFNLWSNLGYSLRGHVRLFFGGRFNLLRGIVNPAVIVLMVCFAVAVLFLIVQVLRSLRTLRLRHLQLEPRIKTILLLSLLWTIVYVVFLFFWLPQNTFYRLFYLPALILLFGVALSSLENRVSVRRFRLAALVAAVALANFLFLIYPYSHVQKYPPLAFALQMNREWPTAMVIYYAAENSDAGLVRYFNPTTIWKRLPSSALDAELTAIYREGATVWLETTAIDQLRSAPGGARWLDAHARKESLKELNDASYRIRFVQVTPAQ
jgi:hypothetical protein